LVRPVTENFSFKFQPHLIHHNQFTKHRNTVGDGLNPISLHSYMLDGLECVAPSDGFPSPPCPQSNFTIAMQGSQILAISLHWQVCPTRLFLGHSMRVTRAYLQYAQCLRLIGLVARTSKLNPPSSIRICTGCELFLLCITLIDGGGCTLNLHSFEEVVPCEGCL